MPYVQKNEAGEIIGRFENRQPEIAEEFLDEDAAELQPSIDDIAKRFEVAVQKELNEDAAAHGWDTINNAVAASGKAGFFKADADLYFKRWNDSWSYCYAELAKVKAGTRPLPTIEEIIGELPARVSA